MKWVENGIADAIFECSKTKTNIFLIGDSIRRGYCATVKDRMSDYAEVFYVDDNCRSSQYIIFSLKKWAAFFDHPELVDIVQFNCGHWDVARWHEFPYPLTTEAEYEKNIRMIIYSIKKFFPNARIFFATTTPMNPDLEATDQLNPRNDEIIDVYNGIATKIARENCIEINDLNKFMRNWGTEHYKDSCHLIPSSFELLGEEVARFLSEKIKEQENGI